MPTRLLILGGGFGGVETARRLERLLRGRGDIEITLVIYLTKLPRLEKKLRVAIDWTLDLVFAKDVVQFLTVREPRG